LQGGYNLEATAASVAACVRVLLGERPPALGAVPPVAPSPAAQATIREVIGVQVRSMQMLLCCPAACICALRHTNPDLHAFIHAACVHDHHHLPMPSCNHVAAVRLCKCSSCL